MSLALVAAFLVTVGTVALFVGLERAIGGRAERLERRLHRASVRSIEESVADEERSLVRLPPWLERRLQRWRRTRFARAIDAELSMADLNLNATEFVAGNATLTLATIALTLLLRTQPLTIGGLVVASLWIPWWYVGWQRRRRVRRFEANLPQALSILVNNLRAGSSLIQALEVIAREARPPLREEFGRVIREVELGRTLEEALTHLSTRVPIRDLELLVAAINVQRDVGGNLIRILEIMSATIRERVRLVNEMRALTAGQELSGYVVCFVPVAIAIVFYFVDREYLMQMFQPGWPLCLPISGTFLLVTGFIVMRRLMSIRV
ncbi:MAG: type II secretion system F family protein [Chloroflexi bacterium]|nr:type II secretion system F family protein [Chloroflexota bacterium]